MLCRWFIFVCALLGCFGAALRAQDTFYAQGKAAYDAKQWEDAISWMSKAEAASPGQTDALLFESKALLNLKRLPEADRTIARYVAQHPDSPDGLYTLGHIQQYENKPRESLATLTRAAQLRTPDDEELRIVANDYVLLDDYPDAIRWLERAVQINPNNADVWYALGRCYYTQSSFKNAEQAFLKTLALNSKNEKATENLGLTYKAENRPTDAEQSFRTAISLADSNPQSDEWPFLNYGEFLIDQGRATEAMTQLERALAKNPKCAACHEKLGRALSANGDFKQGVTQLEAAVSLQPGDAHLHYELGLAYRQAGMPERAQQELALSKKLYGTKQAGPK